MTLSSSSAMALIREVLAEPGRPADENFSLRLRPSLRAGLRGGEPGRVVIGSEREALDPVEQREGFQSVGRAGAPHRPPGAPLHGREGRFQALGKMKPVRYVLVSGQLDDSAADR